MEPISEERLLQEAAARGIVAKRGSIPDPKKAIILDGPIDDLFDLASCGKSILFYRYEYTDPSNFIIDKDTIESFWEDIVLQNDDDENDFDQEELISDSFLVCLSGMVHPEELDKFDKKYLKEKLKKLNAAEKKLLDEILLYNKKVDLADYSAPIGLMAFVPIEGFAVTVMIEPEETQIAPAALEAKKIFNSHIDELISQHKEASRNKEEQEAKLRLMLLKDKAFLTCTNKKLRTRYTEKLLAKNPWVRELFGGFDGYCFDFVEFVWAEYRNDKTIVERLDDISD